MKHRRGIEIGKGGIAYMGPLLDPKNTTFDDLEEYMALGCRCGNCEREGWMDRHSLRRKWGNAYLGSLVPRLRCYGCGNKQGNTLIIDKLPR